MIMKETPIALRMDKVGILSLDVAAAVALAQPMDDFALVDFLLTLPSAGEVRDYVEMYLGASAAASAFATEFLRRTRADPQLAKGGGL